MFYMYQKSKREIQELNYKLRRLSAENRELTVRIYQYEKQIKNLKRLIEEYSK